MAIIRGVDVEYVEIVLLAQVVGKSRQGGASCLGYTVVYDEQIIF